MKKFLLLAAVILTASSALRADDDEEVPAAIAGPEAAAAARDKGYRADEAERTGTADDEEAEIAPIEPSGDSRVISAPTQRPLGGRGTKVAAPGSGGGSAGRGQSCEDAKPRLTRSHRVELPDISCLNGRVFDYWMLPNESISYRFKAPKSGGGTFALYEAPRYPAVNMLANISEFPCDFDVAGRVNANSVVGEACQAARPYPVVSYKVGPGSSKPGSPCPLKPGGVYYFNIRFLAVTDKHGHVVSPYDSCASLNKDFPGAKDPRCGGIFTAAGGDSTPSCKAYSRTQFLP